MSVIPCDNKIGCESDYPVTNYSAENPDPRSFIGYSSGTAPTSSFPRNIGGAGPSGGGPDRNDTGGGPEGTAQTGTGGNPPPLGSDYDNPTVTTFATSTESQEAAHNDAGNDNVSALTEPSDTGRDTGGYVLNPSRQRPTVYTNDAQTCSVACPDGSMFTYTVPVGAFRQFTKAKANAAALSFACKQAKLNAMCLSSINGNVCVGEAFLQTIIADTANIPVTFVVTSGDLPDWVTAEVADNSVQLSGTPETGDIADTSFTITATDAFGFFMSKVYTISVTSCGCAIDTTTLDKFDQGQAYSFQLVSNAIEPALWEMVSGTLPSGLSLDAGGVIFGTPNLINGNLDQTFTVKVTGDDGSTCSKTLTLEVIDYHTFPPGKKWRIAGYTDGMLTASCCQVCVSCGVWNGTFVTELASADFRGSGTDGITNHVVTTRLGLVTTGPSYPEWTIHLFCPSIPGNATWIGTKAGSNAGAKLDSPAGEYTLNNWYGESLICDSTPTLTIEEY